MRKKKCLYEKLNTENPHIMRGASLRCIDNSIINNSILCTFFLLTDHVYLLELVKMKILLFIQTAGIFI